MSAAFYPQPEGVRFELQCEQIRLARKWGCPILISSGPHNETNTIFRDLGATVVVQEVGRPHGAERRRLAKIAREMGATHALWTEEKPYLLRHVLAAIGWMKERDAQALLFNRSAESWQSWPVIQQKSEPMCNDFYNALFGVEGETFDPMLGPVMLDRRGLERYATCDPTVYGVSDTYPNLFAPLAIRANGGYVTSLEVDITYPPEQRAEEEVDPAMMRKRMAQVAYVTTAWGNALKVHPQLKK
jgi:hypothetical protein